jgi:hypothetical protein
MWFSSWLRKGNRDRNRCRSGRKPMSFRLQLETLEDRATPSTLTVMNTLDNLAPGSLRYAITYAARGDTIVFDPSLNGQAITLTGTELTISQNLTIQGPGAGLLKIYGSGCRLFEIDGAATTVNLSGLSLDYGNGMAFDPFANGGGIGWGGGGPSSTTVDTPADGHGGAIWNGGILHVSGCFFGYNSADINYWGSSVYLGGAIYNAGTLTVASSTLTYNSAGDIYGSYGSGGAIYNAPAGSLTVTGSNLTYNTASGVGGGIDNAGLACAISSSILASNHANDGGAVYNGYGLTATITSCTLTGDSAIYGGAIFNDGAMTITGTATNPTTVSGSSATAGGGIFNPKHSRLTISFSDVTNNTAPLDPNLDNAGWMKISNSTVG